MTAIAVSGLTHRYGELSVLDDVSLTVPEGGYAALTGPSGAGKTTLLSLLGGLESVQEGRVEVGGRDLTGLSGDELAAYRRATVGFVFQHYGLLPTLSAEANVDLALALSGAKKRSRAARVDSLLDAVGLTRRRTHLPQQLSGGERQRVAIARALANEPRLLLADEPTGNLDDGSAEMVMDLLESLREARGVTVLVVTHSRAVAARAPQQIALAAGRIPTAI
ncbi:MAG: ABC transporter ATP-binding protein [Acidimicrobiales bacterium]